MRNKKNAKTLSICIPTCNRAEKLENLLSNIFIEIGGIEPQVEVCISDNGSSDTTRDVVEKWSEKLPLKVHFSPINMGYDINAFHALQLAEGRYAMYIGDDDCFEQGSLARLVHDLDSIGGHKAGAVYLNHSVGRGALTDFGFEDIRIYGIGNDDYPPLNICFGGSICVRMSEARKAMKKMHVKGKKLYKKEADPFLLYDFVHAYIFAECIRSSGAFAIEPAPVVRVIANGASLSIEKWFYIDSVYSLYYLQMKKFYPELKDSMFVSAGVVRHCIKRYFAMSYLIIGRPEITGLFEMNREVHLDILRFEGRSFVVSLLLALERLRRTGVMNPPITAAVWLHRILTGDRNFLTEQKDTLNKPKRQIGELDERIRITRKLFSTTKIR